MRLKLMAFAAAISFSPSVIAQTTDPATPTVTKEKKICRREAATGSIIGGKSICHTKGEWAAIDAANTAAVERLRDNPNGFGVDSSGSPVRRGS